MLTDDKTLPVSVAAIVTTDVKIQKRTCECFEITESDQALWISLGLNTK